MSSHVRLEIRGSTNFAGEFTGSGQLRFDISDAARAKISLDYRSPDEMIVRIESTVGFKLSGDDTLTLSAGLKRDLINREFSGEVSARLRIAKDLDVRIEQEFGSSGPKTSVVFKLVF